MPMTKKQKDLLQFRRRTAAFADNDWEFVDAIEAALKEVEAGQALVAYLRSAGSAVTAAYALRLFYSYLMPPPENPDE